MHTPFKNYQYTPLLIDSMRTPKRVVQYAPLEKTGTTWLDTRKNWNHWHTKPNAIEKKKENKKKDREQKKQTNKISATPGEMSNLLNNKERVVG